MKKYTHMFVLFVMMVLSCFSLTVQAEQMKTGIVDKSGVLQEGGMLEKTSAVFGLSRTTVDCTNLKNAMVSAIKNFETSVDIPSEYTFYYNAESKVLDSNLQAAINAVRNENPRFFYLDQVRFSYNPENGKVLRLIFVYDSTAKEKLKEYDKAIDEILENIEDDWSDLEKALFVNDYLALQCAYNEEALNDKTIEAYSAYNVFIDKTAVCQGYALAFMELMDQLSIDCEIVTSNTLHHAWNLVKINGSWYHVDVTWNDPVSDKLGRVRHIYFLKSQSYFMNQTATDRKSHYALDYVFSGSEVSNESANNTGFDDAAWNKIDNAFWRYDGAWIAIEETSNTTADLKTYKLSNAGIGENSHIKTITAKWDKHGTNEYYTGSYSYTWLLGEELYYSLPKKVVSYNLATNVETVVHSFENDTKKSDRIYELKVEGIEVCIGLAISPSHTTNRTTVYLKHEHQYDGIIDCKVDTLCKICGETVVKATNHTPKGTQINCLEAVECTVCTKNAIEAKTSHSHNGVADCTKNTMCTECGQVAVKATSHTPKGIQTNCQEAVQCAVCTKNAVNAKNHTPGTAATCTTNQECTVCHAVLANAHDHSIYEKVTEATFLNAKTIETYCSICQKYLNKEVLGQKLACKKGKIFTVGNNKYKIISNKTNEKGTVAFAGIVKNTKKVVIADTVTIHGVKFKVIQVAAKALRKKTKVTSVIVGKNITTIGKEAFYGMSKVKTITIKSTKLSSVGKNAFKNIYKKAKIKVPKSRLSKYKKLLKGKGQKSSVKITK